MIRFGSRGSQLALAQTRIVAQALRSATGEASEVEVIRTEGDRVQDRSLVGLEGVGFFTKELEAALLEGRVDAAVHSYKDLPVADTPGLAVAAVLPREDPAECLVVRRDAYSAGAPLLPLREGVRVGTSSPRRRASLLHLRPDLEVGDLRGNVNTRVQRLLAGEHDAILIARAGLVRLALEPGGAVVVRLPVQLVTPAAAQGALAVQVRSDDARVRALVAVLDDAVSALDVAAERQLLALLGGGCSIPLGVLARSGAGGARLDAVLFAEGSTFPLRVVLTGPDVMELAHAAALRLAPAVSRPLRGKRVLLVRAAQRPDRIADALAAAGAAVRVLSVQRHVPVEPEPEVLASLERFTWVALTSRRAAERLAEVLAHAGTSLGGARFAAAGEGTAEAVVLAGLSAEPLVAGDGGAAGAAASLAAALLRAGCGSDAPVLFPCAVDPRPELEEHLRAAGVAVTRLPLYRTEAIPAGDLPPLPREQSDFTVFTSPSGVESFFALELVPTGRTVALGPTTARALAGFGVPHRVSRSQSPEGILMELLEP